MSITGFEKLTYELTQSEMNIESFVQAEFRKCVNEKNAKKGSQLVAILNQRIATEYDPAEAKMTEVRLRKFVNYYRANGYMPICATSKGYFISFENKVLSKQVKSLKERMAGIADAANGLQKWIK